MANPYVSPVPRNVKVNRSDHGVDYQGNPGQKVVAMGRARVDAVKADPGGFGAVVYYTLLDGPAKGQQIYVGHASPAVVQGHVVEAGAPVAVLLKDSLGSAKGLVGWVEIGLAKDGVPQYPSPDGGAKFHSFLAGAQTAPQETTGAPVTPPQTVAAPSLGVTPPVGSGPPVGPPVVGAPGPEMPGTASHTIYQGGLVDTWQQLSRLQDLSPDTQRLIQMGGSGAA